MGRHPSDKWSSLEYQRAMRIHPKNYDWYRIHQMLSADDAARQAGRHAGFRELAVASGIPRPGSVGRILRKVGLGKLHTNHRAHITTAEQGAAPARTRHPPLSNPDLKYFAGVPFSTIKAYRPRLVASRPSLYGLTYRDARRIDEAADLGFGVEDIAASTIWSRGWSDAPWTGAPARRRG